MPEKAPEKSNFGRRCSLLSRYLKEKGSFGNIGLGLVPKPDFDLGLSGNPDPPAKQNATHETKPLDFPQRVSGVGPSVSTGGKANLSKPEARNSQLTIFFGGKVIVYNEFPADKAKEIMEVAKQSKPVIENLEINTQTQINPQTQINLDNDKNNKNNLVLPDLNEPTSSKDTIQQENQNQIVERIARRASLHRFFAKRKDRAVARAPYQVNQNADHHRNQIKPEIGPLLEAGQSSQQRDNAAGLTMIPPKLEEDKDMCMEIEEEEDQCLKDLELRL